MKLCLPKVKLATGRVKVVGLEQSFFELCRQGTVPLVQAVEGLLQAGGDPNSTDSAGRTALHLAALRDDSVCVWLLAEAGADLEQLDAEQRTPLELACLGGCMRAARALLAAGASPNLSQDLDPQKPPPLRWGLIDRRRDHRLETLIQEVQPAEPIHEVNRWVSAYGQFHVCAGERNPSAWGRSKPEVFDADETAASVTRRLNPLYGRVWPADYDDSIVLGRYFVFCRQGVTHADLLEHLGLASPEVRPRFGLNESEQTELDFHLHPCARPLPEWPDSLAWAPTRSVFQVGQEVVAVGLVLAAISRGREAARVWLQRGEEPVNGSDQSLELSKGLGFVRWSGLPAGHYSAFLAWKNLELSFDFWVGRVTLPEGQAEWVKGPFRHERGWSGRVRLLSRGRPLAGGCRVRLELGSEKAEAVTRSSGEIDIDLPGRDRCLHLSWGENPRCDATLVLPGLDSLEQGPCRITLAPKPDTQEVSGLYCQVEPDPLAPVQVLRVCGQEVSLRACRDVELIRLTFLGAGGACRNLSLPSMQAGSVQSVALPAEVGGVGFVCLGALSGNQPYETAFAFFRPAAMQVSCQAPQRFVSGEPLEIEVRVHGASSSKVELGVVVQDARWMFPLTGEIGRTRLNDLRELAEAVAGEKPPLFSQAWLDASLQLVSVKKSLQKRHHPLMLDLLPTRSATPLLKLVKDGLAQFFPGSPVGQTSARRTAEESLQDELPRAPILWAGKLKLKAGRAQLRLTGPSDSSRLAIQVFAVDASSGSWAQCETFVDGSHPFDLCCDALPPLMMPADQGRVRGRIFVESSLGPVQLKASLGDQSRALLDPSGQALPDRIQAEGGRWLWLNLECGLWTFQARSGDRQITKQVWVRSAEQADEPLRSLVVLGEGQSLQVEEGTGLEPVSWGELLGSCGQSLTQYPYRCCEQTAAVMLGAWAGYVSQGQSALPAALQVMSQGIKRLRQLWGRQGFQLYPGRYSPWSEYGQTAYQHLLALQRLGPRPPAPVWNPLEELLRDCEQIYGTLGQRPESCYAAWLHPDPVAALSYVRERWRAGQGIGVEGNAVASRAETCYGAAVLLGNPQEREGMLSQLGDSLSFVDCALNAEGRLYSTLDSSALLALITAVREVARPALVCLDDGPPVDLETARKGLKEGQVKRLGCVQGPLPVLRASSELRVSPARTLADEGLEAAFVPPRLSLGQRGRLRLRCGHYQPGAWAQIVLPPCVAVEEGGARLQSLTRDFQGDCEVELWVRAVEVTGPESWHGLAVMRNMYRQEKLSCIPIEICVD